MFLVQNEKRTRNEFCAKRLITRAHGLYGGLSPRNIHSTDPSAKRKVQFMENIHTIDYISISSLSSQNDDLSESSRSTRDSRSHRLSYEDALVEYVLQSTACMDHRQLNVFLQRNLDVQNLCQGPRKDISEWHWKGLKTQDEIVIILSRSTIGKQLAHIIHTSELSLFLDHVLSIYLEQKIAIT